MNKAKINEELYTAEDIQVLEGMEAVRRRPGMYIGSTDQRGLHHLIYEIVDNAVDEFMGGFCSVADITIHEDASVTIVDDGRGIPVDKHKTTKMSGVETVMTTLHAGGKFGGKAYSVSGGLHGVGASVVNALSSNLKVEVYRDQKKYTQEFSKGKTLSDLISEPLETDQINRHGTSIHFVPDSEIFGELLYDYNVLAQRFKEMAYLNKGMKIKFKSDFHYDLSPNNQEEFHYEGGILSFVEHLNASREVVHKSPIYVEKQIDGTIVEVAMQYNDTFNESVYSFANCINTRDGGTHVTGFRASLTRVINDYARKQKFIKPAEPNLSGEDTREGLTAVISVKLTEPQFPVSSIIQASSVTFPSLSGKPPNPTDIDSGSASGILTPVSTASIAFPPLCSTSIAAILAGIPCFQVEITIGYPFSELGFFFSALAGINLGKIAAPIAPKIPPFIKLLLFDISLIFVQIV